MLVGCDVTRRSSLSQCFVAAAATKCSATNHRLRLPSRSPARPKQMTRSLPVGQSVCGDARLWLDVNCFDPEEATGIGIVNIRRRGAFVLSTRVEVSVRISSLIRPGWIWQVNVWSLARCGSGPGS